MLNEQQRIAKDKIAKWFKDTEFGGSKIFTLAGYAGTGKTFLINYLIENVFNIPKKNIAIVTPTGKAASVLIQKGTEASTIHRLIYTCKDSEKKDKNGKPIPRFIKKSSLPDYKLVILDEVSMISKKIMEDLISFDLPILAIGDPGQLPPILAERHDLLLHPNYVLTEIVRQSEDDPIIQVATMARHKQTIPYGHYGESVVVAPLAGIKPEILDNLLLKADQVICGKNATRNQLNKYMRELLGKTSKYPEIGDKIICIQNNYDIFLDEDQTYPLVNGNIGYVKDFELTNEKMDLSKIKFKADFLDSYIDEDLISDTGIFHNNDFTYDRHQKIYKLEDGNVVPRRSLTKPKEMKDEDYRKIVAEELSNRVKTKEELQICQFDFGYAISCHKAQGSEFDKVVIFDESKSFPAEQEKWLYTAITRAKKKLIIIR